MVTTRTKQPGTAAQAIALLSAASNNGSPSLDSTSPDHEISDTIGSRLRKRRRTDSIPPDESSRSSKRVSLQKTTSPDGKRTSPGRKRTSPHGKRTSLEVGQTLVEPFKQDKSLENERPVKEVDLKTVEVLSPSSDTTQDAITGSESGLQPSLPIPPASLQLLSSDHEAALKEQPESTSDMTALMMRIVDRGEQIDNAQGLNNEYSTPDTENLPSSAFSLHLKAQSLPILDNLATQILNKLGNSTYSEILTMVTDPESETGNHYATLMSLFNYTKKVYSLRDSFLNISALGLTGQGATDALRKSNLATYISSVFGSRHVGFYDLNEYFLDTFVADGNRLLKSQAGLFLDLKTQVYISAMSNGDRSREEVLEHLFPADLEERLLSRRQGAKQVAPSEAEFLQRARNRCKALLDEPNNDAAIAALPDKYVWEDFLRDVSSYVSKNFEMLVGVPAARKISRSRPNGLPMEAQQQHEQSQPRMSPQPTPAQQYQQQVQEYKQQMQIKPEAASANGAPVDLDTDDIAGKAARAAQFAMQSFTLANGNPMPQNMLPHQHQQPLHPPQHMQPPQLQLHHGQALPLGPPAHAVQQLHYGPQQYPGPPAHQGFTPLPALPPSHSLPHNPGQGPPFQYQFQHHQPHLHPQPPPGYYVQHSQMNGPMGVIANQHQHLYADANGIPYPTQTAPTQVLYERARQAATAKSTPSNRRTGTPSQRRPWTTEEENALMAGLDRVKGPHWSQILAMFGPGGSINESLKDRNQVQLKDKARNLKLFFLKSGIEVPYYLQFVTGELKTRAPAQAAKNEEGRGSSFPGGSDDREHVEAVMALGGMARAVANGLSAVNGQSTPDLGASYIEMNGITTNHNEDQKALPSIGEYAANPRNGIQSAEEAAAIAAQARRDSTISASGANADANGLTNYEENLKLHLSNSIANDAAAEAAAEAARAIALMGQS